MKVQILPIINRKCVKLHNILLKNVLSQIITPKKETKLIQFSINNKP